MRSVVVVFPASMCAMMPMLRVRARGYWRMSSAFPFLTSCSVCPTCIFSAGLAIRLAPSQRKPGPGAGSTTARRPSPAVMRVGLVGLRHLVHVFAALHRGAGAVRRVHDLGHEALGHRVLAAGAAVVHEPAQRERGAARRPDLDRDL